MTDGFTRGGSGDVIAGLGRVDTSNNFTSTRAPTATDDSSVGWSVGSLWVNTVTDVDYICVDATRNAAIWLRRGTAAQRDHGSASGHVPLVSDLPTVYSEQAADVKAAYESNADTNAFTDADHSKLDGIEPGATADQTAAEIKVLYESNLDTNEFSDAEQTKLAGIEDSATQDQVWGEIAGTLSNQTDLQSELDTKADQTSLDAHTGDTSNPHSVVASQVNITDSGGNYVAGEVESALAEEADARQAHEADTTNPHGVTQAQVGLSAVTNDAQLKIASNLSDVADAGTSRTNLGVDAAGVKALYESNLDTNEFSDAEQSKLAGIESGATADQTAADIRALGFFDTSNDGSGSGLDADLLDGIDSAAFGQLAQGETVTGQWSFEQYVDFRRVATQMRFFDTDGTDPRDHFDFSFNNGAYEIHSIDVSAGTNTLVASFAQSGAVSVPSGDLTTSGQVVVDDAGTTSSFGRDSTAQTTSIQAPSASGEIVEAKFGNWTSSTFRAIRGSTVFFHASAQDGGYIGAPTNLARGAGTFNAEGLYVNNNAVWHAGNDGDASGLDADTVDGQHASAFAAAVHDHSNATTTSDGFMSSTDKSKLNGVESGATADQTAGEIKTAYESNSNTNAYTDSEQSAVAALGTNASRDIFISTSDPSGGSDGDIWYKYE